MNVFHLFTKQQKLRKRDLVLNPFKMYSLNDQAEPDRGTPSCPRVLKEHQCKSEEKSSLKEKQKLRFYVSLMEIITQI